MMNDMRRRSDDGSDIENRALFDTNDRAGLDNSRMRRTVILPLRGSMKGEAMKTAIWIIAIAELIRAVQNAIQLYMVSKKSANNEIKRATDAFIESLKADMEAETNRRTLNNIKSGKGLSPIKKGE